MCKNEVFLSSKQYLLACIICSKRDSFDTTCFQRRQSKYIFWGGGRSRRRRRRGGWSPLWRGLGKGHGPSPENFLDFGSQNGDLWCIPGAIFCSSAKTLRGRKDTLARVYFYWGQSNPSPPPGDRRHWLDILVNVT